MACKQVRQMEKEEKRSKDAPFLSSHPASQMKLSQEEMGAYVLLCNANYDQSGGQLHALQDN